jgi:hypothetical protein
MLSQDHIEVLSASIYALAALVCIVAIALWNGEECYYHAGRAALLMTGGRGVYALILIFLTSTMSEGQRIHELTRPLHAIIGSAYILIISLYCLWMVFRENVKPPETCLTWYGGFKSVSPPSDAPR